MNLLYFDRDLCSEFDILLLVNLQKNLPVYYGVLSLFLAVSPPTFAEAPPIVPTTAPPPNVSTNTGAAPTSAPASTAASPAPAAGVAPTPAPASAPPPANPVATSPQPSVPAPASSVPVPAAAAAAGVPTNKDGTGVDFEDPDAYIDISDALRSRQYVHRAILSTVIRDTSRFNTASFYVSHVVGFSAIWQRSGPIASIAKYSTGMMGLASGYITSGGHAFELGLEFSELSALYLGYRYYYRTAKSSLWPFAGGGLASAVKALDLAQGPPQSELYVGPGTGAYISLGLLIPLVDVGFKAEARATFYGGDRWVFTQGIGAILFL